jgi:membrane associated rhomboid family serine protease
LIPIRDENPSGTRPFVTIALIAVNVLVFLYQLSLGQGHEAVEFVFSYGLVPAGVFGADEVVVPGGRVYELGSPFVTVFTGMFMHASVLHILGNMWFLWLFGDNIEDRLGHLPFLGFYLVCGVGASASHVLFSGASPVPMVGASGAIAGVLGAYLVCFPGARVLTLVPLFFLFFFARLPAFLLLFIWLAGQIASALASAPDQPGVAWWAHIGGFALGAALVLVWPRSRRSRQRRYEALPDVWRERR